MDAEKILEKYYSKNPKLFHILLEHSRAVTKKAVEIAKNVEELSPDIEFIKEAGMLHDIGIFLTYSPEIGCRGKYPRICHGYLGRKILEKEGFKKHGLVCERHIGTGITKEEIEKRKLLLPKRDMIPVTIEEEIISLADKFFSKSNKNLFEEESIEEAREELKKIGREKEEKFNEWLKKYKLI
jgi:uncharacterized protein